MMKMDDKEKKRPEYCPRCGKELPDEYDFPDMNPNPIVELVDNNGNTVWDVYCHFCDWSGYISPDVSEEDEVKK